ncbi:hypothetical protein NW762_004201 [Fusarium torreyae]|uniref:Fungal N-terminal domain-containing protein n=1 Tax=Fusarium torreyae TaxID=1237075 RepID=A0A9W8S8I6_9HYPO|nr:hypothetical protein NW762_004201 [Fusarium torreyae]
MEALGAAASITQFALLSLKCVKEVHNTLSAIKDGPAIVQLVASNFLLLQDILERLVQSPAASANPALDGHIRQCIQNVCSRAEPIAQLQATPGDRSAGRFWKRLKIIVSESDLNRIRSELNQLVTILNLRLCGLSSNAIYELKDETQQIRQQMYSMGLSLNSQFDAQTADLLSIENNISNNYNNGHKDLQASLSLIQQTIDSTSSISASDTASMVSLLNQIKDHVAPDCKNSNKATITTNSDREPATCEPNNYVDQTMFESIDRLCSLIDEKRDAVDVYAEDDGQVESVIDDLQTMLKAVRRGQGHAFDDLFEKGIRRFGRSFGHGELSINSKSRLEELRRMLQNGDASLRDHDENGASLLFYSTRQPEMCKFLLDEGLDADHVAYKETCGYLDEYRPRYHCLQLDTDRPEGTEENVRINACRRLLLTAGADPTYEEENDCGRLSFLEDIARFSSDPEVIDLIWRSGLISPFATFQNWRFEADSPFLLAFRKDSGGPLIGKLRQFLSLGADIGDRTSEGETCLHLLFSHFTYAELDDVVFLLEQGADPDAEDHYDISISELAYDKKYYRHGGLLGYPGDVWDAALHVCGYDTAQFRSYRRRRPRYDFKYTREGFEKLWKGREGQCPYWDDKPWPPLKPREKEESDYNDPWNLAIGGSSDDFSSGSDVDENQSELQDEWLSSEDEERGVSL